MTTKNLFIGGLPYALTRDELKDLFSQAGEVESATVIFDKITSKSKGYGFVEMATMEDAEKAIEMFNNKEVQGKTIVVNEARPRKERSDFNR
ncbi:RNA-binding protein [Patescibacteria group bacterium]|nr:RNA-binding protein [Patescibacteria group bacterium]